MTKKLLEVFHIRNLLSKISKSYEVLPLKVDVSSRLHAIYSIILQNQQCKRLFVARRFDFGERWAIFLPTKIKFQPLIFCSENTLTQFD